MQSSSGGDVQDAIRCCKGQCADCAICVADAFNTGRFRTVPSRPDSTGDEGFCSVYNISPGVIRG